VRESANLPLLLAQPHSKEVSAAHVDVLAAVWLEREGILSASG
jgi:hypothetical protein